MMSESPVMTSLEEQLKQDSEGHYRQKLLDQLREQALRVGRTLNQGCRPEEYDRLQALKEALFCAETVIDEVACRIRTAS